MRYLLLAVLLLNPITTAIVVEAKTITRLQYRVSNRDTISFTQSIFHSFGQGSFVLQIYDREHDEINGDDNSRFEFYLGTSMAREGELTPYSVLARGQKWTGFDPVYAGGIALNFNRFSVLDGFLSSHGIRSFIQFFLKSEGAQLGKAEILHYYQVNELFGTDLYVRGYNIYHIRDDAYGGNILQSFADLIYPMHKHWDIYLRWYQVDTDSPQLGNKGQNISLGFRYNF